MSTAAAVAGHGESLAEAREHDYSTRIVPLSLRRPAVHIAAFLTSIWAGFSYVFMGFTLNEAGFTLGKSAEIILIGCAVYWFYGLFAAYVGSRTGQTLALLTRSVFGRVGSVLVSVIIVCTMAGWIGFQGNLTAQICSAVFGWGHVLVLGIIFTVLMIANNLFGFEGVARFARWVVAPIMIVWLSYLTIKGLTTLHSSVLSAHPKDTASLGFLPAVTFVVGFLMWGEEPDAFRFLAPRFKLGGLVYLPAIILGFGLSGVSGWMMAQLAGTSAFGPSIRVITNFSLFGALWLAFIVIIAGQVAVNDGNYYSLTNAAQNLLGEIRGWKREYTCFAAAALGGFSAWFVAYVITNGFEKVASLSAIGVPTATMIVAADHFLLPRLLKVTRPLNAVPTWRQAGRANWPAIVGLVVAVLAGGWASDLLPGGGPSYTIGIVPLESWALGVVVYLLCAAVVIRFSSAPARWLGFSEPAIEAAPRFPADAVVDVAYEAEHAEVIGVADPSLVLA